MSNDESMQEVLTAIQQFATQVQEQFQDMETRFDKRFQDFETRFDKRFDAVDQRFEQVDQRFDAIDKRFERVDKRFDDVYSVLEHHTTMFIQIRDEQVAMIEWLKRHDKRHDQHDTDIKQLQSVVGI